MTAELKNLYESLIEGMILEGINGMTPELKQIIENAPVEQKRSMILDIMEENNVEHRLLTEKIKKIVKRGVVAKFLISKKLLKCSGNMLKYRMLKSRNMARL